MLDEDEDDDDDGKYRRDFTRTMYPPKTSSTPHA
jgi:hypothetical protein